MPTSWIKCGVVAAREHMKGGIFFKMTPKKQVDFIERIDKTILGLDGLEIVVESDRNCRGTKTEKVIELSFLLSRDDRRRSSTAQTQTCLIKQQHHCLLSPKH